MSRNHARLTGARWQRLRRRALDRDGWRCTRCESPADLEMHHIKALDDGGDPWSLDNVAMQCRDCHIDSHRTVNDPERAAWLALLRGES
ncbi:MAG: HNH endonuclease [Acidobacteria bacterium]|nr:HNH endonuclease [Acidobacteriota bacterium]